MTNLLLFLILLVLFVAFFPMCALLLGAGTAAAVATFWDRYWWLIVALALLGVIGRTVKNPAEKVGGFLGRAVRRLRG